jgi:sucrose-6-phosphate hydrolase SacC (GH32 family)
MAIGNATAFAQDQPVVDKTLVTWVMLADLDQRGGSPLAMEAAGQRFDAIVFGEISPQRWMVGSDFFRRTLKEQDRLPPESGAADQLVQIAIVYRGPEVTLLRNGLVYSRHTIEQPQVFDNFSQVMLGPRVSGAIERFVGEVEDARIYSFSLTPEEVAELKPDEQGPFKPWAWWTFEDGNATEVTGRLPHSRSTGDALVREGRLVLQGGESALLARQQPFTEPAGEALNYHLMHPGGDSAPGDPNAAFCLDGKYHLHYILSHPWRGGGSFSFVHVTSPDMLHWTWQRTKLQPSFSGHGMFSGTGFLTKEGRPAAIYHGQASGRNQIAIAKDRQLSEWEKPYAIEVHQVDGTPADIRHWDPDCFLIGDTYYAISGGENPPLMKSKDLKHWTLVGDFLKHDLPDVVRGEDISCANFFPLGDKWMLLCISHPVGCRYYLGSWDEQAEQFVPESHGRMNFRRDEQSLYGMPPWRVDFFAPESLLTTDGRRVMWAWCATVGRSDGEMSRKTIQSLPRELSLASDGSLRIKPLRELELQRGAIVTREAIQVDKLAPQVTVGQGPVGVPLLDLSGDSVELRITILRDQADRKLFGFTLFDDGSGGGLPIVFRPENGTILLGSAEAPFAVSDLPEGEPVIVRIFIDKYITELFVNDRQALLTAYPQYQAQPRVTAFSVGAPTMIERVDMWSIGPTNQGFLEAQESKIWQPDLE